MALPYPTIIPGLRSPYDQVGGLVYFGRMLDKMRLAAAGKLPEGWHAARGQQMQNSFDDRCCKFLRVDYAALEAETLNGGGTDEELLEWAFGRGHRPNGDEIEIWNAFMTKRGWRDAGTQRLNERLAGIGLPPGAVETMFEFIDLDEGRLKPQRHRPERKIKSGHVFRCIGLLIVWTALCIPMTHAKLFVAYDLLDLVSLFTTMGFATVITGIIWIGPEVFRWMFTAEKEEDNEVTPPPLPRM